MRHRAVLIRYTLYALFVFLLGWCSWRVFRPANAPVDSVVPAEGEDRVEEDLSQVPRPLRVDTEPADQLLQPDIEPSQKLVIWQRMLIDYQTLYRSLPTGSREEILAALAGENPRGIVFISPDHPALEQDDIFFHVISSQLIELRHAGDDGEIFTDDDIIEGGSERSERAIPR